MRNTEVRVGIEGWNASASAAADDTAAVPAPAVDDYFLITRAFFFILERKANLPSHTPRTAQSTLYNKNKRQQKQPRHQQHQPA